MDSDTIRRNADRILYDCGLLDMLREYGTPHTVGSYQMDMMAWNDLDIDIENDGMDMRKLYRLTGRILETFRPSWYEAKEERTQEGKTVWFHGFEAMVDGQLWNVDLWFFDRETIAEAERYCSRIAGAASVRLTGRILETFRPSWYEAKEERTQEGKTVWFHGFEAMVDGQLWNVDLWFFDRETIAEAERYCSRIAGAASVRQREQIFAIKRGLLDRGLYAFDKFHSMDVYRAVLEERVGDIDEFLERYGHER